MARRNSRKHQINTDPNLQRINKVLAAAGLGSRRDVEELIVQGRVEVDGQTVTNLATRIDPKVAKIEVDGQQLKRPKLVYYALNKPKGVLSTSDDPSGRPRVIDFVPDRHRVFSVGRLDRYSEGLMLLTNDGDLAQRLAHPKYRVQKTYFVVVAGILTQEELAKLRKGVYLAEGVARIDGARIRRTRKNCTELEILLSEGKNREIRRILARAGHKVVLLRRLAIGSLRLAELPVGASRELTTNEIKALYALTEPKPKPVTKPALTIADSQVQSSGDHTPAAVGSTAPAKLITPIEAEGFDDFGLGLEGDYQYDESQLSLSEDAIEISALEMQPDIEGDDTDFDDDFVTDFDALSKGSVLGYDSEEETVPAFSVERTKPKPASKFQRRNESGPRQGVTRGRKSGFKSGFKSGPKSQGSTSRGSQSGGSQSGRSKPWASQERRTEQGVDGEVGRSGPSGKRSSGSAGPGKRPSGERKFSGRFSDKSSSNSSTGKRPKGHGKSGGRRFDSSR